MLRKPLANRREHTTVSFNWRWNGTTSEWTVSVSFFDNGSPAEVFLAESPKRGSELESLLQDACILVSHLLQRGMTIAELCKSLSREGIAVDAPAASILGLIVEVVSALAYAADPP